MIYNIILWKWYQPGFRCTYTHEHVNRMVCDLLRYTTGLRVRIILVTDDPGGVDMRAETYPMWRDHCSVPNASGRHLPSCYRRLRIFDPDTQRAMGIRPGERIVSMDLDGLVVANMRPILSREEPFVGWAVRGTRHVRVFNGSIFMFYAGQLSEIWTQFDPVLSPRAALQSSYFGSDQGWLSYKLAKRSDCGGWTFPQVCSYPRELARRPVLPKNVIVVNFHGKRKYWHEDVQKEAPWIKTHLREGDKHAVQLEQRVAAVG